MVWQWLAKMFGSQSVGSVQMIETPGPDWLVGAVDIEEFTLDVAFEVPSVCPSWLLPRSWAEAPPAIDRPALPTSYGRVMLTDVVGRDAALGAFYAQFPQLPSADLQHSHARFCSFDVDVVLWPRRQNPLFAPSFGGGHAAATALMAALAAADTTTGLVYDNLDQGWALQMTVEAEHVFVVAWDWEDANPRLTAQILRLNRSEVRRQAQAALERMAAVMPLLIEAVGHDLWRSRP